MPLATSNPDLDCLVKLKFYALDVKLISFAASVILLGLFASTVWAEPEVKGSPQELAEYLNGVSKTVTISGEAELKKEADKAVVSLRVRTENKSFQECLRLNQSIRTKIIAYLGERGILPADIQTSKFSSTPKYAVFSDRVKSYTIDNLIKITVHDEKGFQAAASATDNWPEVHFENAEFEASDKQEMKRKALRQAFEDVSARKKICEEALGVKLVARRFEENAGPEMQSRAMRITSGLSYNVAKGATLIGASSIAPEPVAEMVSAFGELTFKARVTVEYTLETK